MAFENFSRGNTINTANTKNSQIARNIIASSWVDRAVEQGLIQKSQARHFRKELTNQGSKLTTAQMSSLCHSWFDYLDRDRFKAEQQNHRWQELRAVTKTDMSSFFPEYTPGDKHSFHTVSGFDTETSDSNKILEIAGLNVVWNETQQRFERTGQQWNRFYIPKNLENDITKTYDVHGYDPHGLEILRSNWGADYSKEWGKKELKAFLNDFVKQGVITGHNIRNADLSWINGVESGGFELRGREGKFKHSFLDTLDLAESIYGVSNPGEGRNKLQNIAKRLGVSASQLGIPAHAGWGDVIVNLKVLEGLFRQFPNHPAVLEYKAALNSKDIVHSHRWSQPNPADVSHTGFVTHKLTTKTGFELPGNALKVSVGDFILNGLGISADEYENALKNSGSFDLSSYEEMKMSDNLLDAETKRELDEYAQKLANISDSRGAKASDKVKSMVKALQQFFPKTGEGWKDPIHKLSEGQQTAVDAVFRSHWASSWSEGFQNEVVTRTLLANRMQYQGTQERLFQQAQKALVKYRGKYGGTDFYNELADLTPDTISVTSIDAFNAARQAEDQRRKNEAASYKKAQREEEKAQQKSRDFYTWAHSEGDAAARAYYANEAKKDASEWAKYEKLDAMQNMSNWSNFANGLPRNAAQGRLLAAYARSEAGIPRLNQVTPLSDASMNEWARNIAHGAFDPDQASAMRGVAHSMGVYTGQREQQFRSIWDKYYQQGYISKGSLFSGLNLSETTKSAEEYEAILKKTTETNKKAVQVMNSMYKAVKPFYNFSAIDATFRAGIGEVGGAVNSLLPSIFQPAGGRLVDAMQENVASLIATKNMRYGIGRTIGDALMSAGSTGLMLAPGVGGKIASGAISAVGAGINLVSNIVGEKERGELEASYQMFASKINLFSAGLQAILAPLRLFRNGLHLTLNLWNRLGNIWGSQYGIPFKNLTGINSSAYSTMLTSDTFFGMKAGTLNSMHNSLSLGQAELYGSGRYDEQRLVAAARLGVFDSVYSPMGGDAQEQMATTVDSLYAQMKGASRADKQLILDLASKIDPNLPNILERMDLFGSQLGKSMSFKDYQSGAAYSNVHAWHKMSNYENARWEWTAGEYGASMQGFNMNLKRIATPLWQNYGLPLMNLVNDTLGSLPQAFASTQGSIVDRLKPVAENFWTSLLSILGFESSGSFLGDLEGIWGSVSASIKKSFGEGLGNFLWTALQSAMEWIAGKESELLRMLEGPITRLTDYINASDFSFELTSSGPKMSFTPAPEMHRKRSDAAAKNLVDARKQLQKVGGLANMNESMANIGSFKNWRAVNRGRALNGLFDETAETVATTGVWGENQSIGIDVSKLTVSEFAEIMAMLKDAKEYDVRQWIKEGVFSRFPGAIIDRSMISDEAGKTTAGNIVNEASKLMPNTMNGIKEMFSPGPGVSKLIIEGHINGATIDNVFSPNAADSIDAERVG